MMEPHPIDFEQLAGNLRRSPMESQVTKLVQSFPDIGDFKQRLVLCKKVATPRAVTAAAEDGHGISASVRQAE
jgi:hypothetical protein